MSHSSKWFSITAVAVLLALSYSLIGVIYPFIIGLVIAYLTHPVVDRLVQKRWPRPLAAGTLVLVMLLTLIILICLLEPPIQRQCEMLIGKFPQFLVWLEFTALPWVQTHSPIAFSLDASKLQQLLQSELPAAGNMAVKLLKTLSTSGLTLFTILIEIIVIPIASFYFLRDWPKLLAHFEQLIPQKALPRTKSLFCECDSVLKAFFQGQLLVMLALAIIYTIGFSLIGLDVALLLGIIIAVLCIVPYIGSILGLGIVLIATIIQFGDLVHLVLVLALFAGGHVLENFVLSPWLIGNRIGIHPLAVIFFIFAFGGLFGLIGIIFALPMAAVLMVLLRYFRTQYLSSRYYGS